MTSSAFPGSAQERKRLQSVLDYAVLDTVQDERLDALTRFVSHFFQAPIALITIVDQQRQWFKSCVGLSLRETERSIAFCHYTIMGDTVMEVPDTWADERFADNPLVRDQPLVRYYCGAPLINQAGYRMGSLALLDRIPRHLDADQQRSLELMAQQVVNAFELARARQQLEREKRRLEDKVKQRTKRLRQLNQSKDRFFSIIAHDLLGPVSSVLGSANLLSQQLQQLSPAEIERMAEGIQGSAHRLQQLLANLLEWASTQTGEFPYQPGPVDLRGLAEEAVKLLGGHAHQKGLRIENHIQANLPLEADPNMIGSVLRNLLANAIKFTPAGGFVRLSALQLPRSVQVAVRDSGVGMSQSFQEKLFRIDQKHCTPGTLQEKGTGLGLLLCKGFVERHGGSLRVESRPGEGSTFSFTLPAGPPPGKPR